MENKLTTGENEKIALPNELDTGGTMEQIEIEKDEIIPVKKAILQKIIQLQPQDKYPLNDLGNSGLFGEIYKNQCRYNVTAKEWYIYNGKAWIEDTGGMIVSRYAKELADALLVFVTTIKDDTKRKAYLDHVAKLGQLKYRNTMLQDARDRNYMSNEDLDKDLHLFNCQNGTMDLRTFTFKKHEPNDLLSKISNVWYDPKAESPLFEKFVNEVMLGDKEKIKYLQKILGYSLTGDTSQECCYILYGNTTRNGKSTLVDTIAYMLGNTSGYAMNMRPESLAQKQNNDSRQASGDIARLKGCRFLNASEPSKKMLFDSGLLKNLTGRDPITARHLHEKEFEFYPMFKLFINTNFLPLIMDDTLFSSNRINVVTFDRHFEPREQDKSLKDRLKTQDNLSGIFNWCIEGLNKFNSEGAIPPEAVKAATSEYRSQSDKVGNFIGEALEKSDKNSKAGEIYKVYQEWCKSNGYGAENKTNFFAELKAKGIYKQTGTVDGKTCKNVVIGYITDDWINIEETETPPFK